MIRMDEFGFRYNQWNPPGHDWCQVGTQWNPNRTRQQDPYGYSCFFHWREKNHEAKGTQAVYDDRMAEWDYTRMQEAGKMIGKRFSMMSKKEISLYMCYYTQEHVEVVALAEGCNVSNGYPYFVIWYRPVK